MNTYDVEEAVHTHASHPVLGPAVRTLENLVEWTNSHSDGWAYWPKPSRAAGQLMVAQDTLANLAHPEDEDGADYATVNLALAVESGDVTTDDLARASRILSLYLDLVKAAGQDY